MGLIRGPNIVRSGLILHLDAALPASYPGSGTSWFDLSGNNNHFTLYNSPTFNSAGYFVFDGTNDYARSVNTLNLSATNKVTVCSFFKPLTYPGSAAENVKVFFELTNNYNSNSTGFVTAYNDPSVGQDYAILLAVKGNVGYNIASWNKSNYTDLNWKNSVFIFDTSQSSTENLFYVNANAATLNVNPVVGYANNNTNNYANDYFYICSRAGSSYFTNCNLASFMIYNRVLSASEILQNFNAFRGRFGI
jgi:hypothetical protein